MRIRELKNGREELDQEVLIKGRITNIRMCQPFDVDYWLPNEYRVELDNGTVIELTHDDIFGVLEKEDENGR